MVLNRPPTSKPRGICRYYTTARGCFAGDTCKFLHGNPSASSQLDSSDGCVSPQVLLTPYDSAKTCRYFVNGYCRRGADCWFRHVIKPATRRIANEVEEEELLCSICLEKPTTFGLLGGCSHVFCIQCLKQWRDPANKSGDLAGSANTKKCPMCRAPSSFITPSSRFWKGGEEGKTKAMQAYKESMARVTCEYFQESMSRDSSNPLCPFGKDCFYQHLSSDGTEYVFKDGVDVCMKIHSRRRRAVLEPHILGAMDFDLNVSRHPLPGGMQFFTFEVENNNDDVETLPDSPEGTPRSRAGRRGQPSEARPSDVDATAVALRELERSLDIIIDENSDTGANVELSLLRESLVENIALLLRRNVRNSGNFNGRLTGSTTAREDQDGSPRNPSNDESRENPDFIQQLQIMTQQFVVSIRDSSRTSRSDSRNNSLPPLEVYDVLERDHLPSPPPLEAYEPYGDDSLREPGSMESNNDSQLSNDSGRLDEQHSDVHSPVHESLDPPFVTDGRGRVVWSATVDRSNEVERPDVQ